MGAAMKTRISTLRSCRAIERALKWGWTVRCRLLELQYPVGGIELTVHDVRLDDPEFDEDYEFQVLTIQGWHAPVSVWAIRPGHRGNAAKNSRGQLSGQKPLIT